MHPIIDFAVARPVTSKNIKAFSRLVIENEIKRNTFDFSISLKAYPLMHSINGYVKNSRQRRKKRAKIVINSLSFCKYSRKSGKQLAWFYVYATVVHEIEHLLLAQLLENEQLPPFNCFIASLSQFNRCGRVNTQNAKNSTFAIPNYFSLKNRMVSLPELLCTKAGLHRAFEIMQGILSDEERSSIKSMMESIEFLFENIEVIYGTSSQPYNQFVQNMQAASRFVRTDLQCLTRMPILSCIFDSEGNFYSPEFLFEKSKDEPEFYNELLIRLFLTYDMDWKNAFENSPELHKHIESLSNEYCRRSIEFMKNIHVGEVFLSKDLLQDNAAMLIRNTDKLNKLMKRFNMEHTTGSLIPLF